MSGGYFDYNQYRIEDIICRIEDYLNGVPLDDCDAAEYIDEHNFTPKEIEWVKEHKRTLPNSHEYSKKTIKEIKNGLDILRKAAIYAQRLDWLLSGDDGEESFIKKLKAEIKNLENHD